MKKLLALFLALPLALAIAGCSSEPADSNAGEAPAYADSVAVLSAAWDAYADDEKFFALGGTFEAPVDGAPGAYDLADTETLTFSFGIPADLLGSIDNAATLMHAMNANSFTGCAIHLTEGADVAAAISAIEGQIAQTQWLCGVPEKLLIATVPGNYVVVAFGAADIMDTFLGHASENITGMEVVVDQPIA